MCLYRRSQPVKASTTVTYLELCPASEGFGRRGFISNIQFGCKPLPSSTLSGDMLPCFIFIFSNLYSFMQFDPTRLSIAIVVRILIKQALMVMPAPDFSLSLPYP